MKHRRIRPGSIADKTLRLKAKYNKDYMEELAVVIILTALVIAGFTVDVYDPNAIYPPH